MTPQKKMSEVILWNNPTSKKKRQFDLRSPSRRIIYFFTRLKCLLSGLECTIKLRNKKVVFHKKGGRGP